MSDRNKNIWPGRLPLSEQPDWYIRQDMDFHKGEWDRWSDSTETARTDLRYGNNPYTVAGDVVQRSAISNICRLEAGRAGEVASPSAIRTADGLSEMLKGGLVLSGIGAPVATVWDGVDTVSDWENREYKNAALGTASAAAGIPDLAFSALEAAGERFTGRVGRIRKGFRNGTQALGMLGATDAGIEVGLDPWGRYQHQRYDDYNRYKGLRNAHYNAFKAAENELKSRSNKYDEGGSKQGFSDLTEEDYRNMHDYFNRYTVQELQNA